MRHKQVLEAAFGLELPDAQGGLPGHPELAFHVGRKVLAEERGIFLRAGSPLSKPESTSFPCTVLPQDTLPRGGHLYGTPKVSAPPDSAPG